MKKIISVFLSLILVFSCVQGVSAESKISFEDVNKTKDFVISWYNSGEYYQYGHCQGFINQCWKRSLGGTWNSTCCAQKGWETFGVSSSRDEIPIGASVYFGRNKGTVCKCGRHAGHVGFYIGNDEIIHVYNRVVDCNGNQVKINGDEKAGYIKRTTIDEIINDGYTYLGWGWHSNKELETKKACLHSYTDPNTEICDLCGNKFQRTEKNESKKYVVVVENINLRSEPYQYAGVSNGKAYFGEIVTSIKSVTNMYNKKWYEIKNSKGEVGYTYSGNLKEYSEPKNSDLTISLTEYPTSLKKGSDFGLRGKVTSSYYNIKVVKGYIKQGNTIIQSTTDNPNMGSLNVKNANLNRNLIFGILGVGNYSLIIEAADSSGKTVSVIKNFNVYEEQKKEQSSLSINLEKYPVTINEGSSYGLRGSVDSNYTIEKVCGYVKNSAGTVVLSSYDKPNSKSMNIKYADLNNSLMFNKLSVGNYTMIVEATDNSGRVVTATKNFNVKRKIVVQTPLSSTSSSNGNGVTGTVNIPSSWDNLSIRKGPSTSYEIVGSMKQGAKCIVYTDKTNNGWYYLNYNGIWGYASGKQIALGSTASNTRTGVINIPSSWDNLSIRTGPSTDYPIVGSMNNGVICTVYPDKTSNGWYYVEYGDIKGFAAGNRINLK